jgi:DNA-binding transcriptional regulator LsrR (DeoR family)
MANRDRNYLIDLARKYYIDGLSQQEIASEFNISRPTVSTLLKRCREEKIVEIRIQESDDSFVRALAERLKSNFGIDSAVVVPSADDNNVTLASAGVAAADLLIDLLTDRLRIGLSWGSSLYHLVKALPAQSVVDVEVIQLAGSLGMANPAFDGFELARSLSLKLNGSCKLIQAPVVVKSPELKKLLLQERPIAETMSRMGMLDLALVGLSSDIPQYSSMVREGFQDLAEAERVQSAGGVGHICGLHYDSEGRFLDIPENDKIVGIESEILRKIPKIIGIACGSEKADAILGALRGGLVSSIVTDEHAALRMLSNL